MSAVRAGIPYRMTGTGAGDGLLGQAGPGVVTGVVVGVAASGKTLKLHDAKDSGSASSGNCKFTVALDAVGDFVFGTDGAEFYAGVVAVISGGAPDVTVIVG